jgi:SAM-dependent methyltransferase
MAGIPAAGERANGAMLELLTRGLLVQAVAVAARLRLPDLVAGGPRSSEELTAAVEADPDALARLLRSLAGLGVLARDDDGRYGPTPLSRAIEDAPGSVRPFALLAGGFLWEPWGRLGHSIETAGSAFESLHGVPIFEHLQRDPDARAVFHAWMTANSQAQVPAILGAYDFGRFGTVVDVGGGHGILLAALLSAHPGLTGILYDRPEVVAEAQPLVAGELAERVRSESGDFFASVPAGGDCYVLKLVVHDWADDEAVRILSNVREAIPAGGTLLLAEYVMPSGTAYHHSMFLDLNMLVLLGGGRERTRDEYAALLERAGFTLTRVVPTDSPLSLVEGAPAP